jgi:hypothetical protein
MPRPPDPLLGTRWVHVFEEDTAAGEVYRPDSAQIPLSRRPRRALELGADGGARVWSADAGDRPQAVDGHWRESDGVITVSVPAAHGGTALQLRVLQHGGGRLLIER